MKAILPAIFPMLLLWCALMIAVQSCKQDSNAPKVLGHKKPQKIEKHP